MASPSTTINANLKINQSSVKSAQRTVQSAFNNINLNSKNLNQFDNSLGRITGQASEFKKSMDAATARVFAFGATAAVINGLSQSFKALVASTIDVEKRLIEINSIFGATEKQFASFRKSIFEVAKNTGQSFAVVADGAAELARQGLSAEETAKRLNASLILTRVSGLDAVSSVNSLTAALNGFTSAGLTAESVVNKIIAVDTAFAVSAKDLAEGFQRAGSTAEDAGVSFDELLGLITAVQQKTARGGAVIGNAFKSIFTRLSRGTTISELQELGVQIDASQSGVKKLQALSAALEKVSDPNVASKIKELAGGVFQINVVSAALKDLSSDTSIFADAAAKSAAASNEAFTKNEALNKSLAAGINELIVGATNLAEKIGQITLSPIIADLTSLATKLTDFLNNALDEEDGNKFIQGFFQGIATFIQGPGIVLITTAFLNIFKIVSKFAAQGFKDLLSLGSGQEKIKSIEAGIVQLLTQDASLRKQLANTTLTQAQKEQLVIQAIQRENSLLREQQAILSQLAATARAAGVTSFGAGRGFSGKKGRGFASGFTPMEGAMEVAEARSLGARGAVRPRLSQGTIGGRKFVMNSQETEIPNFGKNGDSAVIPNYAKGFVPNFNRGIGRGIPNKPTSVEDFSKLSTTQLQSFAKSDTNAALALKQRKEQAPKIGSKEKRVNINASPFGFLVPKIGFSQTLSQGGSFDTPKGKIFYNMSKVNVKGPRLPENVTKVEDPEAANLEKSVKKSVLEQSTKFARTLIDPANSPSSLKVGRRLLGQKGGKGAVEAAVGAAFEAGVATALGIDEVKINKTQGDFDLRATKGSGINPDLFKLFNSKRFTLGEFKASASRGNLNSFAKKILKNKTRGTFNLTKASYAKGFIPNFANPLGEAISRETSGTGISKSQVRISNDKRLANKSNPSGLAVTNTRDEPNGLKDVFAKGFIPNFFSFQPQRDANNNIIPVDRSSKKPPPIPKGKFKMPKMPQGAGLGLGLGLSFAAGPIQESISKNSEAAKAVQSLNKELKTLEGELEKVNEESDPERHKELSKELQAVNTSLEKASKRAQDFDSKLTGSVTGITALATILPSLGKAGIVGAGAAAGVAAGVGVSMTTTRAGDLAVDSSTGDLIAQTAKDALDDLKTVGGLFTGESSFGEAAKAAGLLGVKFTRLGLVSTGLEIGMRFFDSSLDEAIAGSAEFDKRLRDMGLLGLNADLAKVSRQFARLEQTAKILQQTIKTTSKTFITGFQGPDAQQKDFNRNFVGGIDSNLRLAQRAARLDTDIGGKEKTPAEIAADRKSQLADQTQADRRVLAGEFNKDIIDLEEGITQGLDKQAQAAGFAGLSDIDTSGGAQKDLFNALDTFLTAKAVDANVGGFSEDSVRGGFNKVRARVSDIAQLPPAEAAKQLKIFSESAGGKKLGLQETLSGASSELNKINEGQAIVETAQELKKTTDNFRTLRDRGLSGSLGEADSGRLTEDAQKILDSGVLIGDAAENMGEFGDSFIKGNTKVTEDQLIGLARINIDQIKQTREIQREFLKGLKEAFGGELERQETILDEGLKSGVKGKDLGAFSSALNNVLQEIGVSEDQRVKAAATGTDDTRATGIAISKGVGVDLEKQIRGISKASGGKDVALTKIQEAQFAKAGELFDPTKLKGTGTSAAAIKSQQGLQNLDKSLDNIDSVKDLANVVTAARAEINNLGQINTQGDPKLAQSVVENQLRLAKLVDLLESQGASVLLENQERIDADAQIAGEQKAKDIKSSFTVEGQKAIEDSNALTGEKGPLKTSTVEGGDAILGEILKGASDNIATSAEALSLSAESLKAEIAKLDGDNLTTEGQGDVVADLTKLNEASDSIAAAFGAVGTGLEEADLKGKMETATSQVTTALSDFVKSINTARDGLRGKGGVDTSAKR